MPNIRKILQYSLEGLFIKEWNHAGSIEKELKINKTAIHEVCKDRRISSIGYLWFYKNNFNKDILDKKILQLKNKNKRLNSRKILQYSINGEFLNKWESINEASRATGISKFSIQGFLRGKNLYTGDFVFIYEEDKNSILNKIDKYKKIKKKSNSVIQIDLNGNIIKKWDNAPIAGDFLKINSKSITECCRGDIATTNEYIWMYEKDLYKDKIEQRINRYKNSNSFKIIENKKLRKFVKSIKKTLPKDKIIFGIYQIRNKINNKVYIGSSSNIRKRWKDHFWMLEKNNHFNFTIQKSWNKHGSNNFEFTLIEIVERKNNLIKRESFWIEILQSYKSNLGYNLMRKPQGGLFGSRHHQSKSILQLDLNENIVKKWDCISDASVELNIDRRGISRCLKNKTSFYKDSIWKYNIK